ncbi:YjgN family protein [Methylopila musalis]|uniref:YjgN family protein n=1 Tax=Methylopila musalis TaxID=1134781 RepID=A0ABW3Z9H1_9HYPH
MTDFHAAGGVRPQFHGPVQDMRPLVLKGLVLTLVTLGVYRFWYQTNIRRFLWGRTEIDGDALEYTGRGMELFLGFLIALAVLIPLNVLIALLSFSGDPFVQVAVQLVYTFGLLFLVQYALYRARRYRLSRTLWRGVRLGQTGSGWTYAGLSFGWGLLTLVTLGLAYPFMRASLERYKVNHTWFGDQQGRFTATGGELFRKGVLFWLLLALLVVAPAAALIGFAASEAQSAVDMGRAGWLTILFFVAAAPLAFTLITIYQAVEFRWWANGLHVGPASAQSDLSAFAFLKTYLGFALATLLFSIATAILFAIVGAALGGTAALRQSGTPALVFTGITYLSTLLGYAALWQLYVVRPLWKKGFESVTLAGLGSLVAAQSPDQPANAFGEGVADALDFGAGF